MNLVTKAQLKPHHCAVNPHLGSEPVGGLWDTGMDLQGPGSHIHRVYIAAATVEDRARAQGWISPSEAALMANENRHLAEQLAQATEELDAMETVVNAIDVIESADFRARKRPGRQKQAQAA